MKTNRLIVLLAAILLSACGGSDPLQPSDPTPAAQRGGITFWGVSDKRSWLGADKQPLLYNTLYRRKDAYLRLHEYLLDRSGLNQ